MAMVASIRYLDTFVSKTVDGIFAERKLMVDWIETRPRRHRPVDHGVERRRRVLICHFSVSCGPLQIRA
jgi:hypothetical protein